MRDIFDNIEDPRSKLRGIFDPLLGIFYFMLADPEASFGECARWDSMFKKGLKMVCE